MERKEGNQKRERGQLGSLRGMDEKCRTGLSAKKDVERGDSIRGKGHLDTEERPARVETPFETERNDCVEKKESEA